MARFGCVVKFGLQCHVHVYEFRARPESQELDPFLTSQQRRTKAILGLWQMEIAFSGLFPRLCMDVKIIMSKLVQFISKNMEVFDKFCPSTATSLDEHLSEMQRKSLGLTNVQLAHVQRCHYETAKESVGLLCSLAAFQRPCGEIVNVGVAIAIDPEIWQGGFIRIARVSARRKITRPRPFFNHAHFWMEPMA